MGFKVGHVFDVSQTEGELLPTIAEHVTGDVERYDEVMGPYAPCPPIPWRSLAGFPRGVVSSSYCDW